MKYITQDWTSTKDGYLFFVQRLQEMLFHYSDDIVKAPVHNTQTLLEEYGAIMFFLILFGYLLTYFYGLEKAAATGTLMNSSAE